MNQEEFEKVAKEYSVYLAKDVPEANCLKQEIANANYVYMMTFFEWLESRYCIVSKEKILQAYNISQGGIHSGSKTDDVDLVEYSKGRVSLLQELFGKILSETNTK